MVRVFGSRAREKDRLDLFSPLLILMLLLCILCDIYLFTMHYIYVYIAHSTLSSAYWFTFLLSYKLYSCSRVYTYIIYIYRELSRLYYIDIYIYWIRSALSFIDPSRAHGSAYIYIRKSFSRSRFARFLTAICLRAHAYAGISKGYELIDSVLRYILSRFWIMDVEIITVIFARVTLDSIIFRIYTERDQRASFIKYNCI